MTEAKDGSRLIRTDRDQSAFFTKGPRLSAEISILVHLACDLSDTNTIRSELTGAVGPPETADAASLTDDGLVKAFEARGEES